MQLLNFQILEKVSSHVYQNQMWAQMHAEGRVCSLSMGILK